ncbi:hypothetical protein AZ66_06975 [Paenibacillus sp. E194]|nr:hypothetical protein AZ66_06975 [Paenibacillus sp. E194]
MIIYLSINQICTYARLIPIAHCIVEMLNDEIIEATNELIEVVMAVYSQTDGRDVTKRVETI